MPPEHATVERKARAFRVLPVPAQRRAIRQSGGLSQGDLAVDLGVTRAAVSRWETGDRTPRGDLLVAYAELLERLR